MGVEPNIEVHIENLVLHGFELRHRREIGRVVQVELTRLLNARGIAPALAKGAEVARLNGGSFDLAADASPKQIGAHIAKAVHGGLGE